MGFNFPSSVDAFWWFVAEHQFDGQQGTPYEHLTVDFDKHLPAVHISLLTPVEAFITRTDRVQVDVYAEDPRGYAEALNQFVTGANKMVPEVGLLDTVEAELAPRPLPYASDRIAVRSAVYRVTTRPN